MTISVNATPAILRRLIANGTLKSRVNTYVNSRIRDSSDSWYAKEVAKSDVDTAERKLTEWTAPLHTFANSVSATAFGLLALAELDINRPDLEEPENDRRRKPEPPHVRLIPITDSMNLPGAYSHDGGVLILGTNPYVPGCGCSQPKGSDVFGRGGHIGLRFIGLAVNQYHSDPKLLLFLPHPQYRTASVEETRLGYAVVAIDTEGHTQGQAVGYRFGADPVEYALGIADPADVVYGSSMASGINAALQFPGSDEYLARHIPNLGTYLKDAAAKLASQHAH